MLTIASTVNVLLSSVSDSEATVSSDNSEGEGPRERERDREGAKKCVGHFYIKLQC